MRMFIVWNQAHTEGFATTDLCLAYEVRKGADTNCFDENGNPSPAAVEFIERWIDDACTLEEVSFVSDEHDVIFGRNV